MGNTTNPELSPAIAELIERSERAAPNPFGTRERVAELCFSALTLAAAAGLAFGFGSPRALALGPALILSVAYLAAKRVEFAVGAAYTIPTQLVFVPMLFLLPTPIVPLVVACAVHARALPGCLRGRSTPTASCSARATPPTRSPRRSCCWRATRRAPSLSHWPLYVGALAAQLALDLAFSTLREWAALGVSPRPAPRASDSCTWWTRCSRRSA